MGDCSIDMPPYIRGAFAVGPAPAPLAAGVQDTTGPASAIMRVHLLKSKLHRATVTGASLHYEGSLTIAEDLMEAVGIHPYERILCSNMANGERWETYAIPGPRGSGAIELNGAVAHLGDIGDRLTIMAFAEVERAMAIEWQPRVLVLDERNQAVSAKAAAR